MVLYPGRKTKQKKQVTDFETVGNYFFYKKQKGVPWSFDIWSEDSLETFFFVCLIIPDTLKQESSSGRTHISLKYWWEHIFHLTQEHTESEVFGRRGGHRLLVCSARYRRHSTDKHSKMNLLRKIWAIRVSFPGKLISHEALVRNVS